MIIPATDSVAVSLDRISKSFGATRAVDDVSLTVMRGSTTALLGPNGAGKTTTIGMLLGLLTPDSGSVALLGVTSQDAIAAGRVGAMLQDGGLLPGVRVNELLNVLAEQYVRPLPVASVLRTTQLEGLEHRRVDRLSGGQLQRLRVAVALIGDPELLVLDEPTAAMDVAARRAFWSAMRDVTESGRTVIFSTHYLEEADAYADRIVMMARGSVIADGTPAAIKASLGMRVVRFSTTATTAFGGLPGVMSAEQHGSRVELQTNDSDTTLRVVLSQIPDAHDIEVQGANLEDAFIALTSAAQAA